MTIVGQLASLGGNPFVKFPVFFVKEGSTFCKELNMNYPQPIKYYQSDVTPIEVSKQRPFEITPVTPENTLQTPRLHPLSLVTIDRVTNKLLIFIREGVVRKIGDKYYVTGHHPAKLQIPSLRILPDSKKEAVPEPELML